MGIVLKFNSWIYPVVFSGIIMVVVLSSSGFNIVVLFTMVVMVELLMLLLLLVRVAGEVRIISAYMNRRRKIRRVEIAPQNVL